MVNFVPPVSALTSCGRCLKWLLYVFNVLFLFSGMAAIGVGVWTIVDPTSLRIVVLTNTRLYVMAALVLIAGGASAICVSFLGCCGARYENKCLMTIYGVLLLGIFVTEFAAGVISLAFYVQIETFANTEMRVAVVEKYGMANHWAATDAYNYMQSNFDCCGFEGVGHEAAQLYQASQWFHTSMTQVPPSCCKRNENGEVINLLRCQDKFNSDLSAVNNVGCRDAVLEHGGKFATAISGVGIGLAMLQLFGLFIAFCLFRRL